MVATHQGRHRGVADEAPPIDLPVLSLRLQAAHLALDAGEIRQDVSEQNDPVRLEFPDDQTCSPELLAVQIGEGEDPEAAFN